MDELNDPGEFGLHTHGKYVLIGRMTNDYPGQQHSHH